MVLCAAFGCNSRSGTDQVSFFRFPRDLERRKLWIQRLNRGESVTKNFAPSVHHRLCSKHFEENAFVLSPKFAETIGFGQEFNLRLKDDAVPTIFIAPERKRSSHRRSATAILEKRRKHEIISSLSRDHVHQSPINTDDFLDSDYFIAEPLDSMGHSDPSVTDTNLSFAVSTTNTCSEPYMYGAQVTVQSADTTCNLTTTTVTTSIAARKDLCQTVQSNPLMWFADVTLNQPRVQTSVQSPEPDSNKDKTTETAAFSVQCQTPHNLVKRRSMLIQSSVTMVDKSTQTKAKICLPKESTLDLSGNDSFLSVGSAADPRDPEWTPDSDNMDPDTYSDCDEADETIVNSEESPATERKFIVYESCLNELCQSCSSCGRDTVITKKTSGTCVICDIKCTVCGFERAWASQPMSGTMPYGNLILCAGIMFSGASPAKFLRALQFAAIQSVSLSTYMNIQSSYLTDTIMDVWKRHQYAMMEDIKEEGRSLKLAGDARCCSVGHTAKFGSYSLMDLHTGKVLDISLVQSNEVANSHAMELEGLKRSLAFLMVENQLTVSDIVTDRHSAVKKYMREDQTNIHHWFDVWHVAKGVYKKLEAAGRKKGCEKVKDWARSISNHLYWCAASSNGDGELVKQKWLSILNHVVNIHEGHDEKFPRCLHEAIEEKDWMIKGFKPYAALEKVVKGRLLLTDIKKLSPSEQTSSLESFHNVVCHYTQKSVHYFHPQMEARLALAALHFNENSRREQAVTQAGQPRYAISFPKARKGEGIAKEIKTDQTFNYIDDLMTQLLQRRNLNKSHSQARRARAATGRLRPPPLAQSTPARPKKEDIINKHVTRFNKSTFN